MAEDGQFDEKVSRWLEETAPARLPERVLDATFERTRRSRQDVGWRAFLRRTHMPRSVPALAGAAVVVLVAALALNFFTNQQGIGGPATPPPSSVAPTAVPTASYTPTARPSLPTLRLPGARGGPPGQYGWQGGPGAGTGMHYVVEDREATAMGFTVGPDCLVTAGNPEPERVEIGDLDGVLIEPYEPTFQFVGSNDEITRAYALDVGDTTLCIFLTWHPRTTEEEITSAEATVQSLRAEPLANGGVRIVFDLFDRWDTG